MTKKRHSALRAHTNAIRDGLSDTRGWLEFTKRQMYDGKPILAEKAIIKAKHLMDRIEVEVSDIERMSQ